MSNLEDLYRQGRARRRRALHGHGERTLAMHKWRKRVKDLRYVAEMLDHRRGAGANSKRLRKLGARADELGELLGEEHDLALLAEHLREGARTRRGRRASGAQDAQAELWRTGRRTRKALLGRIAKRRRQLRRRALRKGKRLYAQKPRAFMRELRGAYPHR